MTNKQHPIIPPTKLVELWRADASNIPATYSTDPGGRRDYIDFIATAAAQWGWEQRGAAIEVELQQARDEKLDECCEWLDFYSAASDARDLRLARRPKPPSLKEQALLAIDVAVADGRLSPDVSKVVRRALEQLND